MPGPAISAEEAVAYFDRLLNSEGVSLAKIYAVREALKHLRKKAAQCERHLAHLLAGFKAAMEPDANSEQDGRVYQNEEYGDAWLNPS